MNPERWRQIDELFLAALEHDDEERAVFLDEACGADGSLRKEVESLIASHEQAGTFIERQAFEAAAPMLVEDQDRLAAGQQIGHYEVIRLLGEGGMGEVYLAQDKKLHRKIALKLLPAFFTTDAERLRRFEQEAHAASALNHPNILTVYEIGEADSSRFIATEYVDGETLRQRVSRSELALSESLDIAIQIASALVAAHRAGVVHRDIKPENLMVREDGIVKVLDFGIAKLIERPTADRATGAATRVRTDTGVVLGTSSYMSPEQARGLVVDARTDIWSLGVVLYEMVVGRVPFEGATTGDVIVSILEHEPPPLAQFWPEAPAELQRIIAKALQKDRGERYQTAKDLLIDLKSLRQDVDFEAKLDHSQQPNLNGEGRLSAEARSTRSQPRWWANHLVWLSAVLILLAGLVVSLYSSDISFERLKSFGFRSSLPPMRVVPITTLPGPKGVPAFSPDGNQIAFGWNGGTGDNGDIYVKFIDVGEPLRLTTNPGFDSSPTWSPDGRYIAFARFSENEKGIFIVPALGGAERKLFSPDWDVPVGGAVIAWSPDGKYLAYPDRSSPEMPYGVWLLTVNSLERHQLTSPSPQDVGDFGPTFSPDGHTLAFIRVSSEGVSDIHLVPAGGGEPRRLTFENRNFGVLSWTADGRAIVFTSYREGNIGFWRLPITGGTPERLAIGGNNSCCPTISRQGYRLAYLDGNLSQNIWKVDIPGPDGRSIPPARLVALTMTQQGPQYSPDGKKIVFQAGWCGASDVEIWLCDSDGRNPLKLTSLDRNSGTPRWSPDGRYIAFDSRIDSPHSAIYVIHAEGGNPRRVTPGVSDDVVPSWSRDGRWIYFVSNRSGENQVWKEPSEGGEAVQVTKKGGFAAFESPDGRYVYYAKGQKAPGIWRVPVNGGEETQVLDQPKGGYWGYWAVVDGGIYYVNTEVRSHPAIEFFSFATGQVKQIAAMEKEAPDLYPGLAVSPDQRSILYAQVDRAESDIILVENFR
jgi:Tol biopolymer transport system component/predicted Ser/Thr protein kinase